MNIKLLSVVVPVYKQEKTIKEDINNLIAILDKTPYDYEIIVSVDGTSLDNSMRYAKQIRKPNVKVIGYKTNKGKGQAIRFGAKHAKGDVITFIDSGMDIDPNGIEMLLQHMKWYNADIIIGSKLHSASIVENYSFQRKFLTYGYYLFVKTLFGLKIRDTQTGLKAYKKNVWDSISDKLVVKRFAFDVEVLTVAHRLGFKRIYDAPVYVRWNKNNSSLNTNLLKKILREFILDTLAIWYRMKILKYYGDGRTREKVFDEELGYKINTGNMTNRKQVIISFVNKVVPKIIKVKNGKQK